MRLPLRPIPTTYDPGYPTALTTEQIQALLRPGLFRRFSRPTLLVGAVLAGALSAGCASNPAAAVAAREPPKPPRNNPKRDAEVDKIVAEILGSYDKNTFWNKASTLVPTTEIGQNPPVKYPHIPISFGNSYIGVFDTIAAKAVTIKLFAAYGLALVPDVTVKGKGYEFVADGFDEGHNLGFKIILPADEETPDHALSVEELKPLGDAVKAGDVRVFVVKAEGFPNMDGDLYTPMEYYLASVIDYLNWIREGRAIDPERVLGRKH